MPADVAERAASLNPQIPRGVNKRRLPVVDPVGRLPVVGFRTRAEGHAQKAPKIQKGLSIAMQLSLSNKVWLSLAGVLILAGLSSGLVLLWAISSQKTVEAILADNLGQAAAIAELKIAFMEEAADVSAYVIDPSPARKQEVGEREARFQAQFERVDQMRWEPDQRDLIGPIDNAYRACEAARQQMMALAADGNAAGSKLMLQHEWMGHCQRMRELCEALHQANNRDIDDSISSRREQTQEVGQWIGIGLVLATGLAGGVLWLFVRLAFQPLHRMADEATQNSQPRVRVAPRDELQTLGLYLDTLKADVRDARSHLAQTRDHLLDAEKLAAVGRLAAGVAHEIRSPLTSLKLRLFSMQKALGEGPRYQTDIQIMSDEITRLDNIVRNFLEFSRPPAIQASRHDICLLLEKTVDLLRYKFNAGRVRLELAAASDLPPALVDAQQLRQVFINLLNNAIDALPNGGQIDLTAAVAKDAADRRMIVVRVSDNGPGIAADIRDRVFDPFVSTKPDGAGLGLWIAQRIVAEHKGRLEIESSTGRGTVFAIWLPAAQEKSNE